MDTLQDIYAYYRSQVCEDLKEYFDKFFIDSGAIEKLAIGIANGSLLKEIGARQSPKSRRVREHLQGLNVLRSTGRETLVGLVMPLLNPQGQVVNLFSFSYKSNPTQSRFLNDRGAIHLKGGEDAIIVDHPMDLLPLIGSPNTLIYSHDDTYDLEGIKKVYVSSQKETIELPQFHMARGESLFTLQRLEKENFDLLYHLDNARPLQKAVTLDVPTLTEESHFYYATLGGREYRISGLPNNTSHDAMKISLRLICDGEMYVDRVDLLKQSERLKFLTHCHQETAIPKEILKKDLSLLLLALETKQSELLAPKEEEVFTMSEQQKADAMKYLTSPDIIPRIAEAYTQVGVVGEENNKLAAYLAFTSRKLDKPLALLIQSTSAAGKSTLMDAVLDFFPKEEKKQFSSMSGQSLYYMGENALQHKILSISEDEGSDKIVYALKVLQTEGVLRSAVTGKSSDKQRLVTNEYVVNGPVAIALTTTASNLNEELVNRCLVLTVDESPEQTQRIHKAQRNAQTLEGVLQRENAHRVKDTMQNIQRLIKPMKVVNPFANELNFTSHCTRTRRDHQKYLTLINTIALMHQYQREPIVRKVNGEDLEMIAVTQEDINLANQIAPQLFGRCLDDLSPQTRNFLNLARKLIKEKLEKGKESHFSKRDFREFCSWSQRQIRRHLDRLVEYEYAVALPTEQGSSKQYQLTISNEMPLEPMVAELGDYFHQAG